VEIFSGLMCILQFFAKISAALSPVWPLLVSVAYVGSVFLFFKSLLGSFAPAGVPVVGGGSAASVRRLAT
jgi:hypothetical protein